MAFLLMMSYFDWWLELQLMITMGTYLSRFLKQYYIHYLFAIFTQIMTVLLQHWSW